MLRVIFDTSIYGLLVLEAEKELIKNITTDNEFKVYGYKPIRKELKNTPKHLKLGKLKTRSLLLSLYDEIINKTLADNQKVYNLAKKYFDGAISLKAKISWNKCENDFKIVACASLNNLDIVISADDKMFKNKVTLEAIKRINDKEAIRTPDFWEYERLVNKFS